MPHPQLDNVPEIDPVEPVIQVEENERIARMLQENENEGREQSRESPNGRHAKHPENDPVEIVRQFEEDEAIARTLQEILEVQANVSATILRMLDSISSQDVEEEDVSDGDADWEDYDDQFEDSISSHDDEEEDVSDGDADWEDYDDYDTEEESEGLAETELNRFPVTKYVQSPFSASCTVCLSEYEDGDNLRILPCCHKFHKCCVDPWLMRKASCPVCRWTVCG